ncbi:hypothetical protein Salat_2429400 [Sesamum alatum]|uniref:Reverse transcriptase zinc-binding domain-containing protein n=1 Tax=Sesamum alatum TaxID=300844 RepID=A0AAE1XY17_9LAMI|nr:hypothetical protein Salat_2429400 [Sesamum alatum]
MRPNARVAKLVDKDHSCRNQELIDKIFDLWNLLLIKSIPLVRHGTCDTMVWNYTSTGYFSMHSAYYVYLLRSCGEFQTESSSEHPSSWSFIWQRKIPPKVQTLNWTICMEVVPVACNLIVDVCPFCQVGGEIVDHHISSLYAHLHTRYGLSRISYGLLYVCSLHLQNFGSAACLGIWRKNSSA